MSRPSRTTQSYDSKNVCVLCPDTFGIYKVPRDASNFNKWSAALQLTSEEKQRMADMNAHLCSAHFPLVGTKTAAVDDVCPVYREAEKVS